MQFFKSFVLVCAIGAASTLGSAHAGELKQLQIDIDAKKKEIKAFEKVIKERDAMAEKVKRLRPGKVLSQKDDDKLTTFLSDGTYPEFDGECVNKCHPATGTGCSDSTFKALLPKFQSKPFYGPNDSPCMQLYAVMIQGRTREVSEYDAFVNFAGVEPSCRSAVETCGPVAKKLTLARLKQASLDDKAELENKKAELEELEKQKAEFLGCTDCVNREVQEGYMSAQASAQAEIYGKYFDAMKPREPKTGDYILGGLQTIMPIVGMGISANMYSQGLNAYSNNYSNYLGFCKDIGIPCMSPGAGGMGMAGLGGMGGFGGGLGGIGFGGPLGFGGGGLGSALGFPMGLGGGIGVGGALGFPMGVGVGGALGFPMGVGVGGALGYPMGMGGALGFPMGVGVGGALGYPMGMGGALGFPMGVGVGGALGYPMGMGGALGFPMGVGVGGALGYPMGMGGALGFPMGVGVGGALGYPMGMGGALGFPMGVGVGGALGYPMGMGGALGFPMGVGVGGALGFPMGVGVGGMYPGMGMPGYPGLPGAGCGIYCGVNGGGIPGLYPPGGYLTGGYGVPTSPIYMPGMNGGWYGPNGPVGAAGLYASGYATGYPAGYATGYPAGYASAFPSGYASGVTGQFAGQFAGQFNGGFNGGIAASQGLDQGRAAALQNDMMITQQQAYTSQARLQSLYMQGSYGGGMYGGFGGAGYFGGGAGGGLFGGGWTGGGAALWFGAGAGVGRPF